MTTPSNPACKLTQKIILDLVEGDVIIDGERRLIVKENRKGFGYITAQDGTPRGSTRIIEYTENGKSDWCCEASKSLVTVES